ncbi:hypothetical protein EMA8858_02004 [Emticicia aquatica]|uniref:DUF2971 domain-containing protein n=1 Tax=Emticicia aquatica TaxID=1681835 RepID=A0ABM9AQF9_9BACT|nr:DUF2971 domain-containing protein [Emticicia aquatica]CAH0995876.1 hypothetical protein EMA8858_02004 [Emticicia aquatica]
MSTQDYLNGICYSKYYTNIYPILHTYMPINMLSLKSLMNGDLFFNQPSNFNDPYDCYPFDEIDLSEIDIQGYRNSCKSTLGVNNLLDIFDENPSKYIKDELNEVLNNIGVKCFSKNDDNMLMWGHYAEKHQGMCLTFDASKDKEFFYAKSVTLQGERSEKCSAGSLENYLYEVDYLEEFIPFDYAQETKFGWDLEMRKMYYVIGVKSIDWKYEEEIRIVSSLQKNNGKFKQNIKYKKEALTAIKFGLKCNENDINMVKKIVKNSEYHHVEFLKAQLVHPKNKGYGIEFEAV